MYQSKDVKDFFSLCTSSCSKSVSGVFYCAYNTHCQIQSTKEILKTIIKCPSKHVLAKFLDDENLKAIFIQLENFKTEVRNGKHGKTAKFWLSYMDHVWTIMNQIESVKTNRYDDYLRTVNKIISLFHLICKIMRGK